MNLVPMLANLVSADFASALTRVGSGSYLRT